MLSNFQPFAAHRLVGLEFGGCALEHDPAVAHRKIAPSQRGRGPLCMDTQAIRASAVQTEHRLEAYATLTPSRRQSRCTAIGPGIGLGDRSTVRNANGA
jgi:hypothetical protein